MWGVEPICTTLQFAPQTYYAASNRAPSARAVRDEGLKVEIERVWKENYRVYGAPKVWTQLNREGIGVARCTVERLMADMGIRGAIRGRKPTTTRSGSSDAEARPPDLLDRDFAASAPNQKWVADLTYVRTRAGFCYVAFIIDCYARRIVGWWVSTTMHTALVLDALEHAIWARGIGPDSQPRPIHHSDAGSLGSICPSTTRTGCSKPVSNRRSGRSGTAMTTPWPSRSSASTRPNWSTTWDPSTGWTTWSWATFEYVD